MGTDTNDMDPDKMAEFTRRDAARRSPEDVEKESHGFPKDAPAADMARQHVVPPVTPRDGSADS